MVYAYTVISACEGRGSAAIEVVVAGMLMAVHDAFGSWDLMCVVDGAAAFVLLTVSGCRTLMTTKYRCENLAVL